MIRLLKLKRWTSDLEIYVKEDFLDAHYIKMMIDSILTQIECRYSSFQDSKIKKIDPKNIDELKSYLEEDTDFIYSIECNKLNLDKVIEFITYDKSKIDMTGILKGYAIHRIYQLLKNYSSMFLINFGGDILGYHVNEKIEIDVHPELKTSVKYIGSGDFCHFSSGNYSKERGKHIKNAEEYILASVAVSKLMLPMKCDYLATLSITDATLDDEDVNISRYDERGNYL